ncbi:MAG: hypothetical protein ACRCVN_02535 [Spirochaetia bacterium]
MRMLRLFLFFLSFFSYTLMAQEANIDDEVLIVPVSQVQFSPPRYYVGDVVELRFRFEANPGLQIVTPPYEENSFYIIDNINISRTGRDVVAVVYLRFFVPGTRSIYFDFGGLTTMPIPLHVSSVLENERRDLFVSYGPLILPGTRLLVTLFIALVILLPFGVYLISKFLKRLIYETTFLIPPYKTVLRKLKSLSQDPNILSDKEFYTELLGAFRTFLSLHFQIAEFHSATADRMTNLLLSYYNTEDTEEIMTIIIRGDMVKFGGEFMESNERSYCIKRFLELVRQIEKVEKIAT